MVHSGATEADHLGEAAPLTAFGNSVAASYLRLVPGQEAPTSICWGRLNRSTLVRVPLDFSTEERMDLAMNPGERGAYPQRLGRPTVEYRSPDGSAFSLLLLSAVALAVERGLDSDEAMQLARDLEVKGNVHGQKEVLAKLEQLPTSAMAAAECLREHRDTLEEGGFSPRLIDYVLKRLEGEADKGLSERFRLLPAAERLKESRRLMHKDLHKH